MRRGGQGGGLHARRRVKLRAAPPGRDPSPRFAPGGITIIGTPAGLGINPVVLPSPHRAVLAGSLGNGNLYVSRWLLPPEND